MVTKKYNYLEEDNKKKQEKVIKIQSQKSTESDFITNICDGES